MAAWLLPWRSAPAANNQILGWNNLGMHCMDSDYSVFSILPPYNTIEAQLIVGGKLVTTNSGYTVTYQAVADPGGSFNSFSTGKGNYRSYYQQLYSPTPLPLETGLAGWAMPGSNNTPQGMLFESTNVPAAGVATRVNWFRAEGIPLTPYDDAGRKNPYPLMRLIARDAASQPIATNDIVLPVSDEMDCRSCHASGTDADAEPAAGWVWDGLPERDYRLNILRRHDERNFAQHAALYAAALAAKGYNPQGLYRGVVADGQPVLCAACHASEALGTGSYSNIPPLTASVHSLHASVLDPDLHITLDDATHRSACYRCHPGATTRCLRGAMGGAVAADGSMAMQCQSCHGNLSQVGAANRVGWFQEPNCQSCHTGTATHNNGQIRYTSAWDQNLQPRVAVDATFATTANTPAPGLSLYRFSVGHGGLQCSACHGSTHAEFPSTHVNDNVRNLALQGHAGVMVECTACHTTDPGTYTGGPHGMHPVGQTWISNHDNAAESLGRAACQPCHGTDYRGTVLSRMQSDRTLDAFGSKTFFRGAIIGCYTCHDGPNSESANSSAPPTVTNVSTNTPNDQSRVFALPVTGSGATVRILSQPANGLVGLSNNIATYFPNAGFVGTDSFTYAAYDGAKNSNLGIGTVTVTAGSFGLTATAHVPPTAAAGWPVAFGVVPEVTNSTAPLTFRWDFGDGSPADTNQFAAHSYASGATYSWTVITMLDTLRMTNQGSIFIAAPTTLALATTGNALQLGWPDIPGVVVEATDTLGPDAHWSVVTNATSTAAGEIQMDVSATGNRWFRLRRQW